MTRSSWSSISQVPTSLLYVAIAALLVTMLSHAQAVLVPIALALMLTFILTPLVQALDKRCLHRLISVTLVILFALSVLGGLGYVFSRQFTALATQIPQYSETIKEKFAAIRASRKGAVANIQKTVEEVSKELDKQELEKQAQESGKPNEKTLGVKENIQPVIVVPSEPTDVERLRVIVAPVFEPLAQIGIVLILTIFMLIKQEDLRNRFIRLVGQGHLTLTTRTMDEAGERISRYLLTQSIINAGFGTLVAAGLFWIGVPYAALWGITAALLRFVPFVGVLLATLMPATLASVLFEGWGPILETLGLFLILDVLTANVIEPLLVGHSTGVSSIALLVSALFWTWLWGPVGLVLSTPLTVCLAVLGKHVPQLEFLTVLLGDKPALEAEVSFYQRLLAEDEDEANEIIEQQLETATREHVFDEILVPTLLFAERDWSRHEIAESNYQFIVREIGEIVRHLAEAQAPETAFSSAEGATSAGKPRGVILGMPARTIADQLTLGMLSQLFDPFACEFKQLSSATLASEVLSAVEEQPPDLVCITALPPGGLTRIRYLCKRLRARFPELRIVVVRPGIEAGTDKNIQRLTEEGADRVATSLTDARTQITQLLLPALIRPVTPRPAAGIRQLAESPA
ncbi:MAG TPA: AI-2E family transporter [Candidatus Binatia bacterium]|jgi:predicted PurR-regulated permease PerM|nr:AI-2E family transporter [Candidatus Binatia bacterium]